MIIDAKNFDKNSINFHSKTKLFINGAQELSAFYIDINGRTATSKRYDLKNVVNDEIKEITEKVYLIQPIQIERIPLLIRIKNTISYLYTVLKNKIRKRTELVIQNSDGELVKIQRTLMMGVHKYNINIHVNTYNYKNDMYKIIKG